MSSAPPVAAGAVPAADGLPRLTAVLLTLWAGSLWTICGLVAPTLFALLPDRHSAGELAAAFFRIEAIAGCVLGGALVAIGITRGGPLARRRIRGWLAFTAGAPLVSEVVVGPLMDSARQAGDMSRFGMLHGVAALLFFGACAGALVLVWLVSRREE
jgi:hypothetical protein